MRLKALNEEPKAYGISMEDELGKSDEEWKSICLDASDGNGKWFFVAEHEGKLIGMLGATEIFGSYMRHQVEICSAFVEAPFRRQGILNVSSRELTLKYSKQRKRGDNQPHLLSKHCGPL